MSAANFFVQIAHGGPLYSELHCVPHDQVSEKQKDRSYRHSLIDDLFVCLSNQVDALKLWWMDHGCISTFDDFGLQILPFSICYPRWTYKLVKADIRTKDIQNY